MCSAGAVVCAHTLHTVGAVAGDSSTNDGDNNIGDISRVMFFSPPVLRRLGFYLLFYLQSSLFHF